MASWWSADRIEATVTPEYISRKLGSKKQAALNEPLSFGQGLTNDTYLDWIVSRGRRLFLILEDIGCPEHIFDVVDKSVDDDDLPFSEDAIADLDLPSASSDKKFIRRQHAYVVQELTDGCHIDYAEEDVVPVVPVPRNKISSSSNVDKVHAGGKIYTRRRISLDRDSGIDSMHFVLHFKALQRLKHPHVASVSSTYTHKDEGYVLLTPSSEMTLKSFFDDPPKSFKLLPKSQQRDILLRWTHCLTSAIAFLHDKGYAHLDIRPSNIFITDNFNIFFGPSAALGALEDKEPAYEKEAYDHAAPEQWRKRAMLQETMRLRSTLQSGGRTGHRIKPPPLSIPNSSRGPLGPIPSSHAISPDYTPRSSAYGFSLGSVPPPLTASSSSNRSSTYTTFSSAQTSSSSGSSGGSIYSINGARPSHALVSTLTYSGPTSTRVLFDQTPYFPYDIFSLNTIIIQLLTFMTSLSRNSGKVSLSSLHSHLGKYNRNAGRGGAPADSSFHANIRQLYSWLDTLATTADKPSKSRKTTLSKIRNKDSSNDNEDGDGWRWRGALAAFVELARHGVVRESHHRISAGEMMYHTAILLRRWDVEYGTCCSQTPVSSGAASIVTALRTGTPATAREHNSREFTGREAVFRDAAGSGMSMRKPPNNPEDWDDGWNEHQRDPGTFEADLESIMQLDQLDWPIHSNVAGTRMSGIEGADTDLPKQGMTSSHGKEKEVKMPIREVNVTSGAQWPLREDEVAIGL